MSPKPTKLVHRDPNTGQFVSTENGDRATAWDDLEKTQIEQTARIVNVSGNQGYNRALPEIDVQRSDVLGLANDEAAELVALEINGFRGYVDNNNYGQTYNFRHGMSVAVNFDDMQWIRDNDIESDNLGTDGEIAGRTRLEDSGRLLWHGVDTFMATVNATSNGAGGVASMSDDTRRVHFRRDMGTGPLIDSSDALRHGAFFRTVNLPTNTNIVQLIDWTGYWDVFEVERIRRER